MDPIDELTAEEIVVNCIRIAGGWRGPIAADSRLGDVGIVDDFAARGLVAAIADNERFGVQGAGYGIHPNHLDVSPSRRAWQIVRQVVDHAVPLR